MIRLALTGDLSVTRRFRGAIDAGRLAPLTTLLTDADAAVGNLETLLHTFTSPASAVSGGTWLQAAPEVAGELREAGFDLVARANNHALGFGVAALAETTGHLDRAGLGHAGAGSCLEEALSPAVLDTPSGRVALLSTCSTLPVGANATRSRGAIPGRPGIAPLRFRRRHTVPFGTFRTLREIADRCLLEPGNGPDTVNIARQVFDSGDGYAVRSEPDTEDIESIVEAVANARRLADFVLVSVHCHECDDDPNWERPPGFLRTSAHRIAEAGAFAVFGHGPHILRGIEVHQGVPILHSLGTLVCQNDIVARYPDDARRAYGPPPYPPHNAGDGEIEARKLIAPGYDFSTDRRSCETVVAVLTGDDTGCTEVTLVPFTLNRSDVLGERGLPQPADPETATPILNRLARLSKNLGSTPELNHGQAHLRIPH